MIKFIDMPNLPEGKVASAVCGQIPYECELFFKENGIEILNFEPNNHIDIAVSTHADMCALHLAENKVAVDKNQTSLIHKLELRGFDVVKTIEPIAGEYPEDVKLNVALFGKNAVGAFSYSDKNVLERITEFNKYTVKQGYTKCSILPVNEKALITDDVSVFKTLKNAFDILLIEKGDIALGRHEYGFIGGASAKISKDEIYFFGDIRLHRNSDEILAFLEKHHCKAVYPKNIQLTDVGGIVSLIEYI